MSKGVVVFRAVGRALYGVTRRAGVRVRRAVLYIGGRSLWVVSRVWETVRPTLIRTLWVNRKLKTDSRDLTGPGREEWREELRSCSNVEHRLAITTLLSIFESDQGRVRAVGSKARGVLQTAGLVFAGDAVALNLALREGLLYSPGVLVGLSLSGIYLTAAVWAALYIDKPAVQHVLAIEDVLALDTLAPTIAESITSNRTSSIFRTNLAEAAIFDVARALVAAAGALIVTITYI